MANVTLRDLTKEFPGGVTAVDGVSLTVEDGEFVVLLGPSGCGKTTLLRMIAGLEQPSAGAIYIDDELVNFVSPKDRNIAMVFQNYALYPHMVVKDNLSLSLRLSKTPRDIISNRLKATAQLLGIYGLLDRMPRQLSGGQQQRVALGRAIVRRPRVFFMDEPLSNLDSRLRVHMRTELIRLHRELGATVVYVTHDQSEAMTMASRIAVMKEGVLQQCAPPETVYHKPSNRFVASFLGNPEMNFLWAEVVHDADGWVLIGSDFKVGLSDDRNDALGKLAGQPVWLGLRPESLRLLEAGQSGGIPAVVDVVEPLGARTLVYCLVGDSSVVADVAWDEAPNVGDTVTVMFAPERAYVFETEPPENALW